MRREPVMRLPAAAWPVQRPEAALASPASAHLQRCSSGQGPAQKPVTQYFGGGGGGAHLEVRMID